jgi:hypothetical protein
VAFDGVQVETEMDGDREVAEMKIRYDFILSILLLITVLITILFTNNTHYLSRYDSKLKQEGETAILLMQTHSVMTKAHESLVKDSNQQKVPPVIHIPYYTYTPIYTPIMYVILIIYIYTNTRTLIKYFLLPVATNIGGDQAAKRQRGSPV